MLTSETKTIEASEAPEVDSPHRELVFERTLQSDQLAAILKATLLSAAEDPTRFVLCGVYVGRNFDVWVATDGHALTRIILRGAKILDGLILERDACEKLLKALPKGKKSCPVVCCRAISSEISFTFDAQVMRVATIDGQFPEFDRVVPSMAKQEARAKVSQVFVDCSYVARLGATFDAFAKCRDGKFARGVTLTHGEDSHTPMRGDAAIICGENTWEVTHVVMPMRK